MTNFILIFANEFAKNFVAGINFRKWTLKGKLIRYWYSSNWSKVTKFRKINTTKFVFYKKGIFKKKFKVQVNGKWFQTKKWTIEKFEKNIKKLRSSRIQLLYWLFVPKIPQNSRKNVSTPETYGVIKYRPHHAVSLL